MNTSMKNKYTEIRAIDVQTTESELQVTLEDGRKIIVPLEWFPRITRC